MGLAIIVLDNLPLLSLDLETTGLRPKTDHIFQIGADQKSGTADTGLFIWSLIKSGYKLINLLFYLQSFYNLI